MLQGLLFLGLATSVFATSGMSPSACMAAFTEFNFESECVRLMISKFLGYQVVVGAAVVKFPQIIKIYNSKSIEGLSISSFYFEVILFTVRACYAIHNSQPFSTYGENMFMWFQCTIQVVLYWHYNKTSAWTKLAVSGVYLGLIFGPLVSGLLPEPVWDAIGTSMIGIVLFVKCPQIYSSWSNGSTGQLAFITNFLQFNGVLARLFTVLTEVDDVIQVANNAVAVILNGTIVAQILWYWNSSGAKGKKE